MGLERAGNPAPTLSIGANREGNAMETQAKQEQEQEQVKTPAGSKTRYFIGAGEEITEAQAKALVKKQGQKK